MNFPTGWTQRFALTVDHTRVVGTPSGFILLITAGMFPSANIDASATSAQEGGGDIRVTADLAGSNRLPIEVVDFHPEATAGNRRCEIRCNTTGFEPSSSSDTTYYVWCKGPNFMHQPAPSMPYGCEAVWSPQDWRAVLHGNTGALPEPYGLWLIRPKAVEFNGATYVTWLDANHGGTGNIRIAKYTHATGQWTTAVTVNAAELIDAHGAPSVCVDPSGYIHVVWCGFSATNAVIKTRKSTNVGDISAWDAAVTIATGGGAADRTYPTMLALSTGTLVLFSRDTDAWHRRVSTDNGSTWGSDQIILDGTQRSYTEWILGASDRVHVAWHTTASSGATNGLNLYYLYSDNPSAATSTWKAIDATVATLPLTSDGPTTVSGGRVFSTTGAGFNTSYLRGLAVDGSNNPMLSCDSFVTGTAASSVCSTFTYSGGVWTRVNVLTGATVGLASSGSFTRAEGGVRYLTGTTWRILVGVTVSGFGEVQEWQTTDGGANWSKVADVTTASSRGNWQAQYVRGTTGPLVATHFATGPTNNTGAVFNSISDAIWVYGSHTDGVASYAPAIPVTTYLRDSTKYHREANPFGSPSQGAGFAAFGGFAQNVTSSAYWVITNDSTISTDLGASVHIQAWFKHNSAGAANKTATKNAGAGNTTPWVTYRDGSNNISCFFGNGSAFIQPITSGGLGSTQYRGVYQFGAGAGAVRLNTTAGNTPAMAGPLATVSNDIHVGEDWSGMWDEFRIGPTRIGANTLDTEYANENSPSTFASSSATALASNSISRLVWMG